MFDRWTTCLRKKTGGLNIVEFAGKLIQNRYSATMRVSGSKLGLMLGRKMHQASDGLNHQGGIAVVFDRETLAVDKNHGQTSGHSFGNWMLVNSKGEFIGLDLGDNYPRGINLTRFTQGSRKSRVVYTFKTRHGTKAQNPAGKTFPKYEAASTGGTTYYQWSNDNGTYTELGGVVQTDAGYLVLFIGEQPPLDNSKVGQDLNAARNVGFVLVREDFENASTTSGSCTTNVVTDDLVKSSGAEEKGGFYTFGGKWCDQRNKGVGWLTSYGEQTAENATRLRVAARPDNKLLLVWEVWSSTAYLGTRAMTIDHQGQQQGETVDLGPLVRLGRRDQALVASDSQVYVPAGDKTEKKLELLVFEP